LCFFPPLTSAAGEFTGNQRAAFPFILAAKEDQTIYSSDCVPDGFSLSDPDHLQASNVIALYNHWLGRQKKGLTPFIVLNSSPLHGPILKKSEKAKGKKKAEYVDVSDDPEVSSADKEEDDDEDEDDAGVEEEDEAPALKFGPPTRRNNEVAPPKKAPIQIAGPSSKPVPTKGRKPKNSKGEKPIAEKAGMEESVTGYNPKSKKRQAEDGEVCDSPRKVQKTGSLRKSGRVAPKTDVDETNKVSIVVNYLK
jgi:hypothetical protein